MPQIKLAVRKFKPGENIFEMGEDGREAYLIRQGYVSIWRVENGRRVDFATRAEGEIVGEMALIDDTVRSATVTAQSEVEVEVLTKKDMETALTKAPKVLGTILHQLLESLRTANDLIAMYAVKLTELTSKRS